MKNDITKYALGSSPRTPNHSLTHPFMQRIATASLALLIGVYSSTSASTSPAEVPQDDPLGNFRTFCDFSHAAMDDPIVSARQRGAAHLHFFFGNTGTNAYSTTETLRTRGASTCQGTWLNKSAYWIPALFDATGDPVLPSTTDIYYKNLTVEDPRSIATLPPGLRMIAGDASGIANDPYNLITAWWCDSAGTSSRTSTIPQCSAGDRLRMSINFPHCWNGTQLDSDDHKSHMAHAVWSNEVNGMLCPATHPVVVPRISYNFTWLLSKSSIDWYIASDRHQGMSMPGGSTLHGDWWNGWHQPTMEAWTEHCIRQTRDCANGNLGNGFTLDERFAAGTGIIRWPVDNNDDTVYCNGRRATIVGSEGDDTISGTSGADVIVTFQGDDIIRGGGGNDVICAGSGADIIYADAGDDEVRAGPGNDTVYGGDGDDRLWGQSDNDQLFGNRGDDALQGGSGNDNLVGAFGHDYLFGGLGDDDLSGGLLRDVLIGGSGADILNGGWQDDRLYGSAGNDQLYGAQDDDRLFGGSGVDTCRGGDGNNRLRQCE